MSATIYRRDRNYRLVVAEFKHADDAMRVFKSMAYDLDERLIMVTNGPITVTPPKGCHLNGSQEYVLNPIFHEDMVRPCLDR